MHVTLRILGWSLAVTLYGIAALLSLWTTFILLVPFIGWMLIPGAALVVVGVVMRLRRRRATSILLHLDQAVRLSMPLTHMLEAQSVSESWRLGSRLSKLSRYLKEGFTVGNALEAGAPEVPAALRDVIAAGERVGRLPQALRHAIAMRRAQDDAEPSQGVLLWGYPVVVLSVMAVFLGFIFLFIIPKFMRIFEDFDADLPRMTGWLIEISLWLAGPLLGVLGADIYHHDQLVPGLVWVMMLLMLGFGAWLAVKVGVLRSWSDRLIWLLPWSRRRALAHASHVIEQYLRAGMPTSVAARAAGQTRINFVLCRRLERWAADLEAGRPIGRAASAAGLPSAWASMTAAAEPSGNLPQVFAFLARHYAMATEQWVAALRAAAVTLMILILALIIGFVVVAMLLPLVDLIWSVTPEAVGGGLMP